VDAAQLEAILKLANSPETVNLADVERALSEHLVAEDDAAPADVVSWPEAKSLIQAR
jgi:hypothetical protein